MFGINPMVVITVNAEFGAVRYICMHIHIWQVRPPPDVVGSTWIYMFVGIIPMKCQQW